MDAVLEFFTSFSTTALVSAGGGVLAAGFLLWLRLRKAAQAARKATEELGGVSVDGDPEMRIQDLRGSEEKGAIERTMKRTLKVLGGSDFGRGARDRLPFVLCVGEHGAGKTTLLDETGLSEVAGEYVDPQAPLNVRFFQGGVVFEGRGDLVLDASTTTSDEPSWRALLKALRKARPGRPLDGVVLTVPVGELLSSANDRLALAERASLLRRKLAVAQDELGMRLPVHVLVTKTDRIAGFADFLATVKPGERGQIFGWSNPHPLDMPYGSNWIDEAMESVRQALAADQQRRIIDVDLPKGAGFDAARWIAFPAALDVLREPLRIYLNQIFSESADFESFPLRGVSFCGGEGFRAFDPSSRHDPPPDADLDDNAHRSVSFVGELFAHRVFYEHSLGQPTAAATARKNRRAMALQAVAASLLVLAPFALWQGGRWTEKAAHRLRAGILEPACAALAQARGRAVGQCFSGEREGAATPRPGLAIASGALNLAATVDLLALAVDPEDPVNEYRLRTVLLPTSWLSPLGDQVVGELSNTVEHVVLPGLGELLDRAAHRMEKPPRSVANGLRLTTLEKSPEFPALLERTEEIGALTDDLALLRCFERPRCAGGAGLYERFTNLVEHRLGFPFVPPSRDARSAWLDAVASVELSPTGSPGIVRLTSAIQAPGSGDPAMPQSARMARIRGAFWTTSSEMFDRLARRTVVRAGLETFEKQLENLELQPPSGPTAAEAYQAIVDTLDTLERDLRDPESAWLGEETFSGSPSYQKWLAATAEEPLLGSDLAKRIRALGERRFLELRSALKGFETRDLGPFLARDDDGEIRLELSPSVLALRDAFRTLLDTRFMRSRPVMPQLIINPPQGTYLHWRKEPLARAVAYEESFESLLEQVGEGASSSQEALRDALAAARETLEANILDRVLDAQELPETPATFTIGQRELFLRQQVENLQQVSGPIDRLLSVLEAPPATSCGSRCAFQAHSAWCQLEAVMETQKRNLLSELDALLVDKGFYSVRDEDFAWWTPKTANVAFRAFDVTDEDGLAAWIAGQRSGVRALVDDIARPILDSVRTVDCWRLEQEAPFRRFQILTADFEEAEAEKPGNALATLESFLTGLASVDSANCLQSVEISRTCFSPFTPARLRVSPPCDYFLERRRSLEQALVERCDGLAVEGAQTAWDDIATTFGNRLAGKFPFAALGAPRADQATPEDVLSFFRVYDRRKEAVRGVLDLARQNPNWPETTAKNAFRELELFLDQMDGVRKLFAVFLAEAADAPDVETLPTFDLQVEFRVNRQFEKGGDQILDWRFRINQLEIEPGQLETPSRWVWGEPVEVRLGWARNSETLPLLPPGDARARVDGKTVIFADDGAWALFGMLTRRAEPREFRGGRDPDPVTLSFTIPTAADPSWGEQLTLDPPAPDAPGTGQTRVYLRLTLLQADATAAEVAVPTFPRRARSPLDLRSEMARLRGGSVN